MNIVLDPWILEWFVTQPYDNDWLIHLENHNWLGVSHFRKIGLEWRKWNSKRDTQGGLCFWGSYPLHLPSSFLLQLPSRLKKPTEAPLPFSFQPLQVVAVLLLYLIFSGSLLPPTLCNPCWDLLICHLQSLLWGLPFLKNYYLFSLCITWAP